MFGTGWFGNIHRITKKLAAGARPPKKPSTSPSATAPAAVTNTAVDTAITEASGLQTNPADLQTDLSDQALGL